MRRDAQVSLQVRKCCAQRSCAKGCAQSVRKWITQKRRAKARTKARAIGFAQKGERWRSRIAPRLGVLFLLLLSLSSLSPLSLTHLASSNSGGSLSTPQSGLAGSPQAHANCQLGVELLQTTPRELHAPRPLVVKPAQHDARTMVVLVVGILQNTVHVYAGCDHWPIPFATTWSYGPVHRVHDARHKMASVATPNLPVLPSSSCQLANGRIGGCTIAIRRTSHR